MEGDIAQYVLCGWARERKDVGQVLSYIGISPGLMALSRENQWESI